MEREPAEAPNSNAPAIALELLPQRRAEDLPPRLAHDLLGIVTIIQGYAGLVPMEPRKKLQEDYCLRILRACRRITDMVDHSQEHSRQGSAEAGLDKRPVDLTTFLGDCLAAQAIAASNKDMVLILGTDPQVSTVSIDPGCVERILSNLLENAIKFSGPQSTIRLTARVLTGSLELEVQDDGPGIPAEEFATLFDAYQTGSSRPTGGERSTGLGLAIVKELVLAHHGVIDVQSEVGVGSTFTVRLRLHDAQREAISPGLKIVPSPRSHCGSRPSAWRRPARIRRIFA